VPAVTARVLKMDLDATTITHLLDYDPAGCVLH
jgi:hypothetical protein